MEHGLSGRRYRPLTQDQVGRIHASALRILEEVGVHVQLPEAMEVFQGAEAVVDASLRGSSNGACAPLHRRFASVAVIRTMTCR